MENNSLKYLPQDILDLQKKIPSGDLISEKWDVKTSIPIKKLLIILSTPRSGSTFLCQKLLEEKHCIAHEYYQPHQYLPIAANRWQCINNEHTVDIEKYTQKLIENRTTDNGLLGINLHGHHISLFKKVAHIFNGIDVKYIYLQRKDILGQAISYELAAQSESWSSEFETTKKIYFIKENIDKRIEKILKQNDLIREFIKESNIPAHSIYFEDFIDSPQKHLEQLLEENRFEESYETVCLKRQSNSLNKRWRALYNSNPVVRKFRLLLGI